VSCHYVGTFLDGVEFDSSYKRNEPSEFVLNSVIPGWTQGLQLIGEGGKVKLYVPAKLGYGDQGTPGVPPASALIFEVELLKVLGPDPAALGLPPIPQ
jgi:FKBP-type peptidyl-prolyl cis-trans isomerase